MNHAGMIVGHAGVMVLVNHILFGDPELRPSIGLSGLQGPGRAKEKQEKERSELRDLVRSDNLGLCNTTSWSSVYREVMVLSCIFFVGWEESTCSQSD